MATILIEEHYGLIHNMIKLYFRSYKNDYHDLYNIGCIALMEAVRDFKEDRGKFSTFASSVIYNKLINAVNDINKHKNIKNNLASSKPNDSYTDYHTLDFLDSFKNPTIRKIAELKMHGYSNKHICETVPITRYDLKKVLNRIVKSLKHEEKNINL